MSGYIWTEEGRMTLEGNSCTLGDSQRGKEYIRRYWRQHDDGTFTVITDYYGVEVFEMEGEPSRYDVSQVTQFTHCTDHRDPSGTEIDCDYERDDGVNYRIYTRLRDAEQEARRQCKAGGPWEYEQYPGMVTTPESIAGEALRFAETLRDDDPAAQWYMRAGGRAVAWHLPGSRAVVTQTEKGE